MDSVGCYNKCRHHSLQHVHSDMAVNGPSSGICLRKSKERKEMNTAAAA